MGLLADHLEIRQGSSKWWHFEMYMWDLADFFPLLFFLTLFGLTVKGKKKNHLFEICSICNKSPAGVNKHSFLWQGMPPASPTSVAPGPCNYFLVRFRSKMF